MNQNRQRRLLMFLVAHKTFVTTVLAVASVAMLLCMPVIFSRPYPNLSHKAISPELLDPIAFNVDTSLHRSRPMSLSLDAIKEELRSSHVRIEQYPQMLIARVPRSRGWSPECSIIHAQLHEKNGLGVAVMLRLASHYSNEAKYLARDVFFIFDATNTSISTQYLLARNFSGSLSSCNLVYFALQLDLPFNSIRYELDIGPSIGRLPNIDLVVTALKLCHKNKIKGILAHERTQISVFDTINPLIGEFVQYLWSQMTMTQLLHHQYLAAGIDSLLLRGRQSDSLLDKAKLSKDVEFASVVEGLLRGINNLDKPLHLSWQLYLPLSKNSFVPLASYMAVGAGLLIAPALKVLVSWISMDQTLQSSGFIPNSNVTYLFEVIGITLTFIFLTVIGIAILFSTPASFRTILATQTAGIAALSLLFANQQRRIAGGVCLCFILLVLLLVQFAWFVISTLVSLPLFLLVDFDSRNSSIVTRLYTFTCLFGLFWSDVRICEDWMALTIATLASYFVCLSI